MTEDQKVGNDDIGRIGRDRGVQRRAAVAGTAQNSAAHERQQKEDNRAGGDVHIGRGMLRDIRLQAKQPDDGIDGHVAEDRDRNGNQNAPDQRLTGESVGNRPITRADRLRHQDRGADIECDQHRDDQEDHFGRRSHARELIASEF